MSDSEDEMGPRRSRSRRLRRLQDEEDAESEYEPDELDDEDEDEEEEVREELLSDAFRARVRAELSDLEEESRVHEESNGLIKHPQSGIMFDSNLYEVKAFRRNNGGVTCYWWRYAVVVKGEVGYVRCLLCKKGASRCIIGCGKEYHAANLRKHYRTHHKVLWEEYQRACTSVSAVPCHVNARLTSS